ncbi:MAG: gluconate 2-dehydrogenase subunit 3 family protein, partial [Terriglobales bacterium]
LPFPARRADAAGPVSATPPGGADPEAAPSGKRQPIACGGPPRAFAPAQFALLTELVDLVLPRTDTPGAVDAGAHWYVDQMAAAQPALGLRLRSGLNDWARWVTRHSGAQWRHLAPRDQLRLLALAADGGPAPAAAPAARAAAGMAKPAAAATTLAPELTGVMDSTPAADARWVRELKTLVLTAYFQSEIGREEQLQFVGQQKLAAMPGCPEGIPAPSGRPKEPA